MKHGPFISALAQAFGLEERSVRQVARAIREAGYLTTGARGVNAPDMTIEDAARMTIALMTGKSPSRVLGAFERLRKLVPLPLIGGQAGCIAKSAEARELTNLEDYLVWTLTEWSKKNPSEILMSAQRDGEPPDISFMFRVDDAHDTACLIIGESKVEFGDQDALEAISAISSWTNGPIPSDLFSRLPLAPRPGIAIERSIYEDVMDALVVAVIGPEIEARAATRSDLHARS